METRQSELKTDTKIVLIDLMELVAAQEYFLVLGRVDDEKLVYSLKRPTVDGSNGV